MTSPDPIRQLPLDHVAIAVESIDLALPTLQALSGGKSSDRERVESQGVEMVFLGSGPGKLELVQPLAPDSHVGRFLAKRGPGLHHIAYRVDDLQATLDALAEEGYELIDDVPRPGAMGHQVAFIHPRSTAGVLIELVQHRSPGD